VLVEVGGRALAGSTEADVRAALELVSPDLARLRIEVRPSIAVKAEWRRSTAIVDERFAVKFAWDEAAAAGLWREVSIQQALAATAVKTANLVTSSERPTLIVCDVAIGRPLTYEDAGRMTRSETRGVAACMAGELARFHDAAVTAAFEVAHIARVAARPQATTNELRERLPRVLTVPTWRRTAELLARVDELLAHPEPAVIVHGDWHGHNLVFDHGFKTVAAVLDFGETGINEVAFDFRYLPRQAPTLHLLDSTLGAYRAATGQQVSRDRVLAWHVLTDLGDALWRTEAAVEVVAGPIERRAIDLHDVLVASALQQ
jgi:hypothetical protein